jgi:hypothetical protein
VTRSCSAAARAGVSQRATAAEALAHHGEDRIFPRGRIDSLERAQQRSRARFTLTNA